MNLREDLRRTLGLRPGRDLDPFRFGTAISKTFVEFDSPAARLELDPATAGLCHLVRNVDPYATSGGYFLRRLLSTVHHAPPSTGSERSE